ncbi:MAG: BlaI/MecI/CopY family transcriptional regulator [Pirellulales bacterium]|nr:BlaI/MecI/CopY family transcriptional regulator [Pirellulales bacterium]
MARPKSDSPTPGELEVLKILWEHGPSTVRQVMERLSRERPRHYTSFMSLLNVMTDKGLVTREPQGRAFVYEAAVSQEKTSGKMLEDLLQRAFEGSASALVARLLDRSSPSEEELKQIHELIERYNQQ